jgi:hypothetical protein
MAARQHAENAFQTRVPVGGRLRRWSGPGAAFPIAFAAILLIALLQGRKPFYYDSGLYWALSETFSYHGHFSLLNFESPLRGYLLPLINRGLWRLGPALGWKGSVSAKLFNTLLFSLIGTVLVPRIAELAWPERRWGLVRRLVLVAVLLVFWCGFLNFPLSDFPALTMVLIAIVAAAHPTKPAWALLAGAATAAAIDMRPSYLLLAPIVLALIVWGWFGRGVERPSLRLRVLCVGLLIASFVVVSLPQSLSAHRHYKTWSFVPGAAAHLESLQLTDGLWIQSYETYVGTGHGPQMFYEYPRGLRLVQSEPQGVVKSDGQYVGLIVKHPITMATIFFRHVVNGLDQRYNTPYIEHLDDGSHRWLRIAGFLLVFLALLRVIWPAARRRLGVARWRYPVALLLCCLTSLPSAMETRYLLPVYALIYMLVLAPGWPSPIEAGKTGLLRYRTASLIVVAFAVFLLVVWRVVEATSGHLVFG